MKQNILISCLFLFSISSIAQNTSSKPKTQDKIHLTNSKEDEEKEKNNITRWNFGLNAGAYFANKYPAGFYNGSPGNENTVGYVMKTDYWYQQIKQSLGVSQSDNLLILGYPTNMHYNMVMTGGLFIRYNFNRNYGVCIDVNYTKLKATDAVVFGVPPNPEVLTDTTRFIIPIQGTEQRVHFDIMLQRNFWLKSKTYFFIQGGLNLNYTKVLKHVMVVNGTEYNLVNIYGPGGFQAGYSQQEFPVLQGGVGYGFVLGGGVGLPLISQLGIEPGFYTNFNNVNLTNYPDFKFSYGIYVRFLFGNILPKPEED
ncbi:MAG: hypothetical protein WCL00_14495 [Bacteroidota bacterium]